MYLIHIPCGTPLSFSFRNLCMFTDEKIKHQLQSTCLCAVENVYEHLILKAEEISAL